MDPEDSNKSQEWSAYFGFGIPQPSFTPLRLIVSAENITNDNVINYRYYEFNGAKNIVNIFMNEQYKVNEQIGLLVELQIAYNKYRLYNEKFLQNDFSIQHSFFNPRVGINYKFNDVNSGYATFARVSREPRLND
ncbi:MAG: TonB-dependent receptor, partial [Ignavibacteriaceae bacterium]